MTQGICPRAHLCEGWMFAAPYTPFILRSEYIFFRVVSIRIFSVLTHSTLGKIFSRRYFEMFFSFFPQKTGFDISCKLSPKDISGDNLHEMSNPVFREN